MLLAAEIVAAIGFSIIALGGFIDGASKGEFSRVMDFMDDFCLYLPPLFALSCPSICGILIGIIFGFPLGIATGVITAIVCVLLTFFILYITEGLGELFGKFVRLVRRLVRSTAS